MGSSVVFAAKYKQQVKKNNNKIVSKPITDYFIGIQTPDEVTEEIYTAKDPVIAYLNWINRSFVNDPDLIEEYGSKFKKWLSNMKAKDASIKVELT